VVKGTILFEGQNILEMTEKETALMRGNKISMIYQDPTSSLNPVQRVGNQIAEAIMVHKHIPKSDALKKAVELMRDVGIPAPDKRVREYPHRLSGGMRQRIMIAMALSCNPKIVIADEPTTMLDLITQSQIIELMKQRITGKTSVLYITHDLGIVAELCNRVTVMYSGKILESGSVQETYEKPLHPYTEGLLRSVPRLDSAGGALNTMPGVLPNPANLPVGCRFHPRCPYVMERCKKAIPPLIEVEPDHLCACYLREK
jgi:oligopeptide/dipeptide ABC transporter ATP-binding protein